MTTGTPLGRHAALAAVYAERYLLAPLYFYMAWQKFVYVSAIFEQVRLQWEVIRVQPFVAQSLVFGEIARGTVALLVYLFSALFLLLGSRATVLPHALRDVLVPLAAVSFALAYDAIPWFPAAMQQNFCPTAWRVPLLAAGIFLGVAGPVVAVWALFHLRRSFGIFVLVRKVVLGGPYRWVRHPMYFGYICMLTGLVLMGFSVAYFVLVPAQIALLVWRARLEEARLSECSEEYREYRKRTGFIFPRFRLP